MNKTFILEDRVNNIQKVATGIVKFVLEGKDYIIYCVDENEENRQIFVSRFITNTEGKYFIEDISNEEKPKLSDIVYNIVILTPTNHQKGEEAQTLLNNLTEKYRINLNSEIPDLGVQEYHSNCSIAITSKALVNLAITFYKEKLEIKKEVPANEMPTWNIPSAPAPQVSETPVQESVEITSIPTPPVSPVEQVVQTPVTTSPVVEEPAPPVQPINNIAEPTPIPNTQVNSVPQPAPIPNPMPTPNEPASPLVAPSQPENLPNPQAEKLAIMSDPSLSGITGTPTQPNMVRLNNKGKANVKYIVIGTICILLAIAVVIVAYILIQKKTTGV